MSTFLLTWNPKRWNWDNISEMSQAVKSGKLVITRWSCGKSKRLQNDDRVFLIKQGKNPRGIFAAGSVVQSTYEDLHWEPEKAAAGKTAKFVRVRLDTLLNPGEEAILPRQSLDTSPFAATHWDSQSSGIQIIDHVALELEKTWSSFTNLQNFTSPEEAASIKVLLEGSVQQITVNAYERNPIARKKCIEYYGTSCFICHFSFGKVFGELGDGFIHVHHLRSLSAIRENYQINPVADLRPVCPNCHAMIHRQSPPLSIEQIKELLRNSELHSET